MKQHNECGCNAVKLASRREFLHGCGLGFGSLALATLLHDDSVFAAEEIPVYRDLKPRAGHFPAKVLPW